MCILFLHTNPDAKEGEYRLVAAANRDEFYERRAVPALQDENGIIGGRDMEQGKEGGMWLGLAKKEDPKKYCFTLLTNLAGTRIDSAQSGRGYIVRDYLRSRKTFPEHVEELTRNDEHRSGYNLISAELSREETRVYYHSSIPAIDSIYHGNQTLVFSNSPTVCPYRKASVGYYKFQDILAKGLQGDHLVEELFRMLKDRTRHLPDAELEKRVPSMYEKLSSTYVEVAGKYGTRTHTIVLIDHEWNAVFIERTMKEPINLDNLEWIDTKILSHL